MNKNNGKYYITAATISVSLVFWLGAFGFESIFSNMSCNENGVKGKATLCFIKEAFYSLFGSAGITMFFIAGGVLMLYVSWKVFQMENKN